MRNGCFCYEVAATAKLLDARVAHIWRQDICPQTEQRRGGVGIVGRGSVRRRKMRMSRGGGERAGNGSKLVCFCVETRRREWGRRKGSSELRLGEGECSDMVGFLNRLAKGEVGAEMGVSGHRREVDEALDDGREIGHRIGVRNKMGTAVKLSRCLCMTFQPIFSLFLIHKPLLNLVRPRISAFAFQRWLVLACKGSKLCAGVRRLSSG
ncbi:hypothetical protein CPC08DRAFT_433908 [Agrocybe pediades]|nr:hypothetical protein CPC08DRAFT_433908 [Agrocybe pediades]